MCLGPVRPGGLTTWRTRTFGAGGDPTNLLHSQHSGRNTAESAGNRATHKAIRWQESLHLHHHLRPPPPGAYDTEPNHTAASATMRASTAASLNRLPGSCAHIRQMRFR